ncbi:DUF5688 family protein [Jutongia huaianensis]|uniref:Uncharacterized protein n=1 Tax=Jutongia huaianensis TaxID=2763668 RepID=A0ABR7MYZ4_9FIRM|nr:DUF5688 family protein [Jutongia huaianensis]MBC8561037.1 hypothetical protein [Jutongia huaianensis]
MARTITYEEFKEEMWKKLRGLFREDHEIRIQKVRKVNLGEIEAFNIYKKNGKDQHSPNFYCQELYERYQRGLALSVLVQDIKEKYQMMQEKVSIGLIGDVTRFEEVKNKIIFTVISGEKNKELLEEIPHRAFLDLAVIYRIVVKEEWNACSSMRVTEGLLEQWGITEEELFETAMENMKYLMPVQMLSYTEMIRSLTGKGEILPEEIIEECDGAPEEPMYVVTNYRRINGFGSILYPEVLEELCQKLQCDHLYILPSSIHEAIVMAQRGENHAKELKEMVKAVNRECVSAEEYLSDSVYQYHRATGKISIAA